MRNRSIVFLFLALLVLAMPANSFAKAVTSDDLSDKIDDLQTQIDDLKQKNASVVSTKFPVELYGFVAAQAFLGTARTLTLGNAYSDTANGPMAAPSRVVDKTTAKGGRHTWFGVTPQNSRIGLNWKGSKVSEKLTLGGTVELDFLNVINNTVYAVAPIPRIRLLFLELSSNDNWSLIAGQNWEIFSPLNTTSLNIGGNVWYQGNLGTRRPQIRFTYNFSFDDINKMKVAVSANQPANTDDLLSTNSGVTSGIPMGEALVQYSRKMKYGDLLVAVSGMGGAINDSGTYRKEAGVSWSMFVPLHKYFKLTGEVAYGQNLGYFLSYVNMAGNAYNGRNMAAWGQITSQWCEKLDTAAGYGIDDIRSSTVATGNVERNQLVFANFRYFPVKSFYVGLEYNYLRTNYKGNGASQANLIFSNLVYNF